MVVTVVDSVVNNLIRISSEINSQGDSFKYASIGHVLGYKLNDKNTIAISTASVETYSVYTSVGVYLANPEISDEELIENVCSFIDKKTGKFPVIVPKSKTAEEEESSVLVRRVDVKKRTLEPIEHEFVSQIQYFNNCLTFNVSGSLRLLIQASDDGESSLQKEIERQLKLSRKITFQLKNGEFTMNTSTGDSSPITELYSYMEDERMQELTQLAGSKAAKEKMVEQIVKKMIKDRELIEFTFGNDLQEKQASSPIEFEPNKQIEISLPIECVFKLEQFVAITALGRAFEQMFKNALEQTRILFRQGLSSTSENKHIPHVSFFTFLPIEYSSALFLIAYPNHLDEEQLVENRRQLCQKLNLPFDRPTLRRANKHLAKGDSSAFKPLVNPHASLILQSAKGRYHIVQGLYSYYHYMQQGFNDNGWGCAYRSLQTLISWFAQQGYIQINRVPTHNEIQQTLVNIGDKPSTFVGSKQWIGSQEVGFVLNELYGIDSKFLYVSSGAELESKGRQLAHHFDTQGTPVMVGGGNLAHTILGVDFNENTGKLRFLILDPHYTGTEELNTILNKGWCGWKEPKFWDKNSFYNLCMPQRPNLF